MGTLVIRNDNYPVRLGPSDQHFLTRTVLHLFMAYNFLQLSNMCNELRINPFQSNFSANRILPSSYLFWAVKRLVDYL
jgi:hypothetical protein